MSIIHKIFHELTRTLKGWVFLIALLVYTVTLSGDVTMQSLPLTAKVAGWDWQPLASHPVLWVLTLPCKVLPAGCVPVVLNFMSAVFAALCLGLLAHIMQLLPWSFPFRPSGREKTITTIATLLAVVMCGFEFNFWLHATAATGETLDLLLLAAAVWCVLEYRFRNDKRRDRANQRWLNAAAIIWGVGMAENWAMIIDFPVFVGLLIWACRLDFFNKRLVRRLGLLVLAGFSVYALVPMINGLSPFSPWSFVEAWRNTLHTTHQTLSLIYSGFWQVHPELAGFVVIYLSLPLLLPLIRLRSEEAFSTVGVERLQLWFYYVACSTLVMVCLWLEFDPTVSPRQIILHQFNWSLPLLSFDFFTALSAGFLGGNLVMSMYVKEAEVSPEIHPNWFKVLTFVNRIRRVAFPVAVSLFTLFTVALAVRNFPAILRFNSEKLTSFADLAVQSLPPGGGVILGDNAEESILLKDCLARHGHLPWVVIDVKSLYLPQYRNIVARQSPGFWPADLKGKKLSSAEMLNLMQYLANSNQVYCLQSGFNCFYEAFQLRPEKFIFKLVASPRPALQMAEIQTNELFWDAAWRNCLEQVGKVSSAAVYTQKTNTLAERWLASLKLARVVSYQSVLVGNWSSATLNSWGVELQRAGLLHAAQIRFQQALALNPNNYAALVNRQCNHDLQVGMVFSLTNATVLAQELGSPASLFNLVQNYGYIDDPSLCYLMGTTYQQYGLDARAIREYLRVRELAPGVPAPGLALIQIYSREQAYDKVIELASQMRQHIDKLSVAASLNIQLSLEEARSWLALGNVAAAQKLLQPLYAAPPADRSLASQIFQVAVSAGDLKQALKLVDSQIAANPGDMNLQINRAAALIQLGSIPDALAAMDQVLAVTNAPLARLNRGIANLRAGNDSAAEADFLQILPLKVEPFWVNYHLGVILSKRGDTNQAIGYFKTARSAVPPGTPQWKKAGAALKALGVVADGPK